MIFNVGDKVIVRSSFDDEYIGGIHNYNTDIYNKLIFGEKISFDKLEIETIMFRGTISKVGKHNCYLINTEPHNKKYILCNDYNEMSHDKEV